jgi:hypothetical protein
MRLVAVYNSKTGEITALCALPPDADAPTVGMQMKPGESRAEVEAPEGTVEPDDPQLHAQMKKITEDYRIESTSEVKIIKKTPANG